jgi:hypothetical protein
MECGTNLQVPLEPNKTPMKSIQPILTAGLALAALSLTARAEIFPVFADTVGVTKTSTIAKVAGGTPNLAVSSKSSAFIHFAVQNSGIPAAQVRAARLVIYFPRVVVPGTLKLTVNTTGFTETFSTKTIPIPTTGATVADIPVTAANSKNFYTVDVTSQVVDWLNNPTTEFGFGISAIDKVSVLIGAKEGPATGYPATLEVDTSDDGTFNGTDGNFSGTLTAGAGNFSGTVYAADGVFSGNVSGNAGAFSGGVSGTTGTFSGQVSGNTGAFSGLVSGSTGVFTDGLAAKNGFFTGPVNAEPPNVTNLPVFHGKNVANALAQMESTSNGQAGYSQKTTLRSYYAGILSSSSAWTLQDTTAGVNAPRLTVLANGNFGVGNPAPEYKLDIAGAGDAQFALRSTSTGGRIYSFQSSEGDPGFGDGSFQIVDRTAGAARMMITKTGNVGIGTSTGSYPAAKLDVRGDIKLGASGQLFAQGAEENLRTVRGYAGGIPAVPVVVRGAGYSIARTAGEATGSYDITYTTPFTDLPVITATPIHATQERFATVVQSGNSSARIRIYNKFGGLENVDFLFVAIGPR